MAETNKLLKKTIKNTYNKVNCISNPPPNKASNTTKTPIKVDKTVKFADKSNKDSKDSNKTSKSKTAKVNNKKILHLTQLVRSKLVIPTKTQK